jgi:hypothetical protein
MTSKVLPPAIPQASNTGAWPGALHGLAYWFGDTIGFGYEPKFEAILTCASKCHPVGLLLRFDLQYGTWGRWAWPCSVLLGTGRSLVGSRVPLPVHFLQPIVHPLRWVRGLLLPAYCNCAAVTTAVTYITSP